jgi:hypothetical protein
MDGIEMDIVIQILKQKKLKIESYVDSNFTDLKSPNINKKDAETLVKKGTVTKFTIIKK